MKSIHASVVLAALASATALAQPNAASSSHSWTGYYGGVQAGVSFSTSNPGRLVFDTDLDGAYDDTIGAFRQNFSGRQDATLTGGIHGGYDFQMGQYVFGAVADYNWMKMTQQQSGFSSTPAFYTEQRSLDSLGTIRVRAGYLFSDRVLGYLTGGLAFADIDHAFLSDTGAAIATAGGNDSDTGSTWGGGVDLRLDERWSLGVEYLYTDLGRTDFVTNLSGPAAFSGVAGSTNTVGSDVRFDFETVTMKLSYRF